MSIRLHHVIYAAVAVAILVALASRLGGEEGRVAKQLDALAELIAKDAGEGGLETAGRARRIGDFFTDTFAVSLEPYGIELSDRASLGRQFAAYRHGAVAIEARFTDREILIDPGERSATVATDAVLTARYGEGRGTGRERYRLRFEMRRVDGDWRIHRLVLVEVVAGPERFF